MNCGHTKDNSWWEYDARGIPLTRVCDKCRKEKLSHYRRDVLTDGNYEADEDIEPEPTVGGYDEGMAQGGDQYTDVMYGDSPDW